MTQNRRCTVFGFKAQHSDSDTIIQSAWAFHSQKWGLSQSNTPRPWLISREQVFCANKRNALKMHHMSCTLSPVQVKIRTRRMDGMNRS